MSLMQGINAKVRKNPKRVIFAEGEDENMLKAAIEFGRNKWGTPILIGAEKRIKEQLKNIESLALEEQVTELLEKEGKSTDENMDFDKVLGINVWLTNSLINWFQW